MNPVVEAVRWYQRWVSPTRPPRCRFTPSCSRYMIEAVEQFGTLRGVVLGSWRLARCNPFSRGGVDDVPERFRLSIHPHHRYPIGLPEDDDDLAVGPDHEEQR